jgi:hypothetical protein
MGQGKYRIKGSRLIVTIPDPGFKIAKDEQVFLFPEANTLSLFVQSFFLMIFLTS